MDLPDRAPSRQTGAICIRHYDEGRNPFTEAKALMDQAKGKPLEPCKFKERFLLQHIENARNAEERKRKAAMPHDAFLQQVMKEAESSEDIDSQSRENDTLGADHRQSALSPRSHVAVLEARLKLLDEELWGEAKVNKKRAGELDASSYLEWELECTRLDKRRGWADALTSETDVRLCGLVVPFEMIESLIAEDGSMHLGLLLKAIFIGLTDEGLEKVRQQAEKLRPLPLRFNNARALHRFFADAVKRFGNGGSKLSKRSGKPGLDKGEFCNFCGTARVMIESEAARVFDQRSVEAITAGVGKVLTADEFATLYSQ